MYIKKRNGFTLSELLIVVAIIGILTAVAIPVFNSQTKKSKLTTNSANAQSLYNAIAAYYMGNDAESVQSKLSTMELTEFPGKIIFDNQEYIFNDECTKIKIDLTNEIQPGLKIEQGDKVEV